MALKSFGMIQAVKWVAKKGNTFSQTTIDVIFTNSYSEFETSDVLEDVIRDRQAMPGDLRLIVVERAAQRPASQAIMFKLNCRVPKRPQNSKI